MWRIASGFILTLALDAVGPLLPKWAVWSMAAVAGALICWEIGRLILTEQSQLAPWETQDQSRGNLPGAP